MALKVVNGLEEMLIVSTERHNKLCDYERPKLHLPASKKLWHYLKDQDSIPTHDVIAMDLHMAKKTIQKSLNEIAALGLPLPERRKRNGNQTETKTKTTGKLTLQKAE